MMKMKMNNLRKRSVVRPARHEKKVLNPKDPQLQKWNKIFVITCVMAVSVDPMFFYIPVIDVKYKCLDLDKNLKTTACILRTFFDIFYILHIIFEFRTGFLASPSSHVFGWGELISDPVVIMKRYLSSYFMIDILSIIPLPQVLVLAVIGKLKTSAPLVAKDLLKYTVLIQYVPRLLRIYPLFREVTRTSGILTQTAWAGAAHNLFLYMLASHVVGAIWYLFSVESEVRCWSKELKSASIYHESFLGCGPRNLNVFPLLNRTCSLVDPDEINEEKDFNFGISFTAIKSRVVYSTTYFHSKLFYCFWWGLRNVSSLGQNLNTSTYAVEIAFAVFISIFGLILFALLIGNMQEYLQSITVTVEEMRVKWRDAGRLERWMAHRMLPEKLKERIRRDEQYKWQENMGVDEEALICNLPRDLRREVRRHLCSALVKRVPMFESMDGHLLDEMCDRLKSVLYTEKTNIIREEYPIYEMIFIMRGRVAIMNTNSGRAGFLNPLFLTAGDFCGEELLTWAFDPHSSNFPISTRTIETLTEVQAFALMADDLKFVASQFRRLHGEQLQHIFRFYSPQWKIWAACFIQAAWRRYKRRKIERSLREAEEEVQDDLPNEDKSTLSLGATINVSKFAANALRNLKENNRHNRMSPRLLPLLPAKPAEPDFSETTTPVTPKGS